MVAGRALGLHACYHPIDLIEHLAYALIRIVDVVINLTIFKCLTNESFPLRSGLGSYAEKCRSIDWDPCPQDQGQGQ